MKKYCYVCKKRKDILLFSKNKSRNDGVQDSCKKCRKKVQREYIKRPEVKEKNKIKNKVYRLKNIEKFRAYVRESQRRKPMKDKVAYAKKWRHKNRKKFNAMHAAHAMVGRYLKMGNLKKENCIKCGNEKSQAHHNDYRFPLKVIWLCPVCHKNYHIAMKGKIAYY